MMPRLVLFDIDGTILSPNGLGRASLDRALEERYGRAELSAGVSFGGRMDPDIIKDIVARAGEDCDDTDAILERYLEVLEQEVRERPPQVLPGVGEVLRELHRAPDVIPGLVTGNLRRGARLKLEAAGLWDVFATGGFGDEAPSRTDLIGLARARAEKIAGQKIPRNGTFHVGDTISDVIAAREGGAIAIAVTTGVHTESDLRPYQPEHLLDSLDPPERFLELVLP